MTEIGKWLFQNNGLWGVIVWVLAGVVVYLDRRSTKAMQDRIDALRDENKSLKDELRAEHAARLADKTQATEALLRSSDKTHEGVSHLHGIAMALKSKD